MKRSRLNRKGKSSISKLKSDLDTVFSQYIRRRDAVNDYSTCVTCGKQDHWKKLQCGHYIPRNHMSTRFSEDNCHTQCAGCNVFKGGAMDEYALFIIRTYGQEHLDKLNQLKHTISKWSEQDYLDKIDYYKNKLKELDEK